MSTSIHDLFPLRPIPHDADVVVDPYLCSTDAGDYDDPGAVVADLIFVSARARDWVCDLMMRSAEYHAERIGGLDTPDHYRGRPIAMSRDVYEEMLDMIPPTFMTLMLVLEGTDTDGPYDGHDVDGPYDVSGEG
jgi:hypothetical protein